MHRCQLLPNSKTGQNTVYSALGYKHPSMNEIHQFRWSIAWMPPQSNFCTELWKEQVGFGAAMKILRIAELHLQTSHYNQNCVLHIVLTVMNTPTDGKEYPVQFVTEQIIFIYWSTRMLNKDVLIHLRAGEYSVKYSGVRILKESIWDDIHP